MNDSVVRRCGPDCQNATSEKSAVCFLCHNSYHSKCYNISKNDMKSIGGACNIQFVCDSCLTSFNSSTLTITNPQIDVMSVVSSVSSLPAAFSELTTLMRDIQQSLARPPSQPDPTATLEEMKGLLHDVTAAMKNKPQPVPTQPTAALQAANFSPNFSPSTTPNHQLHRKRRISPNALIVGHKKIRAREHTNAEAMSVDGDLDQRASNSNTSNNTAANDTKTIVVSKLHPSTDANKLLSYVHSKTNIDISVFKTSAMIPKGKTSADLSFITFKLVTPSMFYDLLKSESVWPSGVIIRDFVPKPRESSGVFL